MDVRDRTHAEEHTLGELFSDLTTETKTLLRQELELAKTEISQKAVVLGKDVGLMAAGGVVLYTGVLVLVAALVIGLGYLIGYALSALIIGLVITGAGTAMVLSAKKDLQKTSLAPEETKKTLKETKTWIKAQAH